MKAAQAGYVRRIYKSNAINGVDNNVYIVEISRTGTKTKGITKYIMAKGKPKVQAGQYVNTGDEL